MSNPIKRANNGVLFRYIINTQYRPLKHVAVVVNIEEAFDARG